MDKAFYEDLKSRNFSESAVSTLKDECITSKAIFKSLRAEHLSLLMPKMKIGEHCMLLSWWESLCTQVNEYSIEVNK